MPDFATLNYDGKDYNLPLVTGTENEKAIDISKLRKDSGLVTLDYGYTNTGSTKSQITFVDGEKGILRYRGYNIEDLAAYTTFPETAWLLIYGNLPTREELGTFRRLLTENALIHENLLNFFREMPPSAHPMGILGAVVNALGLFTPRFYDDESKQDAFNLTVASLISKVRTIAAFSYKASIGEPFVYPDAEKSYCSNFLNMMFSSKAKPYNVDPLFVHALNVLLIVHADHEQNCSTSTVRMVGSSQASLYASICAGICALWGPLHGGANQAALETLMKIHQSGLTVKQVIEKAKNKKDPFKLYGFGHRVYKNYDPRAKVLKGLVHTIFDREHIADPLLDIASELEEAALNDDYFIERKLYPNVDFYSGILYHAMEIPTNMLTVMFAIGRLPGWIAHWKEMHDDPLSKINRPRQIYTGYAERPWLPIDNRG
ncbi:MULTISPECIES: citrate synthase [Hallerella]|uniref:citrate synthase n=1 Tax=Hallerella TaxID=2815788 RepID=UPI000D0DF81F|nr:MULTISPECIES: citrate synthase [Hallerella]MBS7391185.1 citrate synthase [Fibrobacter sp.]MCI6872674.1 citrate synthase [Hallerella sp.]MDD6091426.1 citrate synthase [Hallerella succinigenes]MDY5029533.1 citrate synthase [Hallerella succinigenes]